MLKSLLAPFIFCLFISCSSDSKKDLFSQSDMIVEDTDMKLISKDMILSTDQGLDHNLAMDQSIDHNLVLDQEIDQMIIQEEIPDGLAFSQPHMLMLGSEDLYYFSITEKKTVLLETSSDGQGSCPSSLDTILTLYQYQAGMRSEPYLAKNDDKDTLAGQFCSRIATVLEPGVYQVAVGSYHDQAIDQYVLTLSFPNPAQLGEVCNAQQVCIDASFCDLISQTCLSNAPQIQSAKAYYDADKIYLSADVQDLDLDSGILDQVIFFDANHVEIGSISSRLLDLYQSKNFSFVKILLQII
jgi:hypothetical protein